MTPDLDSLGGHHMVLQLIVEVLTVKIIITIRSRAQWHSFPNKEDILTKWFCNNIEVKIWLIKLMNLHSSHGTSNYSFYALYLNIDIQIQRLK